MINMQKRIDLKNKRCKYIIAGFEKKYSKNCETTAKKASW